MHKLMNAIITEENFRDAWHKVRTNLGAPGVDRVSVEEFERNLEENLALLREIVQDGTFQPLPLLSFQMEKKSGKMRTLHIPAVRDRILQVIQPLLDKQFLECSYAYRPGKSIQKAVDRVERNLKRGRVWILDADIENFFDEIDRPLLLKALGESITEEPLLKLIETIINAWENETGKGVAQGLVLAPILSNVYLHPFDDCMMRATWNYLRYSDNIVVLDQTEDEIKRAQERAQQTLTGLKLKFNTDKTKICHLKDGFTFLGFHFDERGKRPADAALERLDTKIGEVLQSAAEYTQSQLKQKLDSIIRGWLNYFKLEAGDRRQLLEELEQKYADHSDALPQRIIRAALAYQLGDKNRAQQEIQTGPATTSEDADINFQWGVMCELVGLEKEALDSYLAAERKVHSA